MSMTDRDQQAELEDQRAFLLRSLEDLEREHAAGDVDEHDYRALKDDYTARAAAVLRAIEAATPDSPQAGPRRSRRRTAAVVAGILVFAALAGVLVAQGSARRDAGDIITGGLPQSITQKLNEAGRLGAEGDLDAAIGLYDEVLEEQPANIEALTYKGWLLTLSGEQQAGLTTLIEAATTDPEYPDVHAFLAIVFLRAGLVDAAARELDRLEALDPPAVMRELTDGLREQIAEARSSTTTTTTAAAPAAP